MILQNNSLDTIAVRVADRVSAMLAFWDENLVCRFANQAYLEWFGRNKEDMIDKMTIIELLGPLYEKNLPYIQGALEGRIQTFEREIPLPDGSMRHSIANYYPEIIDGKVIGFYAHVADVTPMKFLEKELLNTNDIITQQNKRLLNFSNIISHNLKSYSNNLASIVDMLTTAQSDSDRTELLKFLKGLSSAFSSTVDHLNSTAKLQDHEKLNYERVNLYDYIEKTCNILRIQIRAENAEIINEVKTATTIFVNPAYLESILLNLLSNAIKYRHPDRKPIIEISSFENNAEIVLCVKDNGRGIDMKKHGHDLFGMYKTFHGNPDAQGIGLFITKYQLEAMGAKIKVEGRIDEGCTFSIHFIR